MKSSHSDSVAESRFRILYLEDDAAHREAVRQNLESRGVFAVDFAANTAEADQHLADAKYDFVLADVSLDGDDKHGDVWLLEKQQALGDTYQAILTAQPRLIADPSRLRERGIRIVTKGHDELSLFDELSRIARSRESLASDEYSSQTASDDAASSRDQPPSVQVGVVGSGMADKASVVDLLGFEAYVDAVAAFLTHPQTALPLTMSIEGEWGSGKSSFMRQLEAKLTSEYKTVQFNAWRHEKADEMWAAFALHFIRSIRPDGVFTRAWKDVKLSIRQFDFVAGWPDVLRLVCWFIALAAATITIISVASVFGPAEMAALVGDDETHLSLTLGRWFGPPLAITSWFAVASVLMVLWRKFMQNVKSPLEIELRKYLKRPDYESKLGFVEKFQDDLAQSIAAYLKPHDRVFVFIDDLDRCELPQAAELMRAINLMLTESGPICFVIGMDREKIAAALAVKHERLLPYLSRGNRADDGSNESLHGILFGYAFIEKFIQIPFAVPELSESNIDVFLSSFVPNQELGSSRRQTSGAGRVAADINSTTATEGGVPDQRPTAAAPKARVHAFVRQLDSESQQFGRLVRLIAPSLGYNPRRIKQFANMFRLRLLIAFATDVFVAPSDLAAARRITLEKLAKFVAIELRWPILVGGLETEHDLIAKLETLALGGTLDSEQRSSQVNAWAAQAELMLLLRVGFDADGKPISGLREEWLLGDSDFSRLTHASVRRRTDSV